MYKSKILLHPVGTNYKSLVLRLISISWYHGSVQFFLPTLNVTQGKGLKFFLYVLQSSVSILVKK